MIQTSLSFLSWCKILSGALCIWTRQNQPEFEQIKYWIFSHQEIMLNMLPIMVSTENITHILQTCISSVDHLEHSASLLSDSGLLHWLFDISEDKWAELDHCQGRPTKQIKFLQGFPSCCLKETVYTHYATVFYEASSFKNEEEWGRLNTEAMPRKTERNGNIMKW